MSFDIYRATVPAMLQTLNAMSSVLDKAEAYANAKKTDPLVLTGWRMTPDMFPMSRQIQIMCDFAKGAVCRLTGTEVPKWSDDEKTIAELKARIAKTIDLVKSFKPEQFADAAARPISIEMRGRDPLNFDGATYLVHFVMPNFYFHASTAYAILRSVGVEIGKMDFMGRT